jgi:predicted ATP-grasp superfamily ATP-dependent carboligase
MTEASTLPISAQRDTFLSVGARLVLPDHEDVMRAFDKGETTRLAKSLGISVPVTVLITSSQNANEVASTIDFPVILKPRSSEEVTAEGTVRTTGRPLYASNLQQFFQSYKELADRAPAVLVQQYVRGEGMGYFALMRHGELRAEFAHRRVRDVYPSGSGSSVRVSVAPEPEIREAALAILSALRWHGVAMVEFRRLPGKPPIFIEVNGRFWHSLALPCYAGVDFPAMVAQLAENGDVESVASFRPGVRCRWLVGDMRHLLEVWRGAPKGYPEAYPGKLRTLFSVLTPVAKTNHDLFIWSDPLPELGDWLDLGRRLSSHNAN